MEMTDEALARRVQQGETETFGILVERYSEKLRRYARKFLLGREDAEDLVQEVFIKAYVNINSFDAERRFSPWVYRIAHNVFINAIARKRFDHLPFFDPDVLFPHPISSETADKHLNETELRSQLEACLDKLPAKYREILLLFYFEDLSYTDIADILHVPIATVGVRLSRARTKLALVYSRYNQERL